MKKSKQDRRVVYTKRVLKKSLLELLEKKDIVDISISELCRFADINRNTFYTHYSSPSALFEEIENEIVAEVLEVIQNEKSDEELIRKVCDKIFSMRNLNKVFYLKNDNKQILEKIFAPVKKERLKLWYQLSVHKDEWYILHMYNFTQYGIMAVIDHWIKGGYKESPEKIAQLIIEASELVVNSLKK